MAEDCLNGIGNTGFLKACGSQFKDVAGMIIVPTFADDGTENHIDANEVLDDAFLAAQINETDPSKRWYPLATPFNAFESTRADPTYEELDNGSREFVKQGARTVNFQVRGQSTIYLGQIKACPCEELSFYLIDSAGKLMGIVKDVDSSDLYPIKMQPSSLYSAYIFATPGSNEHLTVSFQFALNEEDSLLRVYDDSLVESGLLALKGLLDVSATFSAVTTTSFTVKLSTLFTIGNKYNASGLVAADFVLKGNGTPIVITSVTEVINPDGSGSGTYNFVIPSTLTSVVKQLIPTKAGFDFAKVIAKTFTV